MAYNLERGKREREVVKMIAVRGIYDGQQVQLLEPVPITTRTPVVVTFLTDEANWQYPTSTQPNSIGLWISAR
jgi:hypothetical protein